MRRFAALAYMDPDNDEVALIAYAFPGRFDEAALRAMSPAARWQHVYAALEASEPDAVLAEGGDAAQVRRANRCFAEDHLMGARYAPKWVYPGQVAMLVARPRTVVEGWRPFLARAPEVHDFDLIGTKDAPNPHNAMMMEPNAAQLAEALNRALGPA
jgi:hypothetical protein